MKTLVKNVINQLLEPHGYEIRRSRGLYQSETSKCRARLIGYCTGYGIDIGPGGDPIVPAAVRVDLPQPYSNAGLLPVQLGGSAENLHWFKDNSLDYVYSSHVLEDFMPVDPLLKEWIRVLKPGGNLVIYCPVQEVYEAHCRKTGQPLNDNHKDPHFDIQTVQAALDTLGNTTTVHQAPLVDIYSFEIVAKKIT